MRKARDAARSGVQRRHGALLVSSQRPVAMLQIFRRFTSQCGCIPQLATQSNCLPDRQPPRRPLLVVPGASLCPTRPRMIYRLRGLTVQRSLPMSRWILSCWSSAARSHAQTPGAGNAKEPPDKRSPYRRRPERGDLTEGAVPARNVANAMSPLAAYRDEISQHK